MSWFSYVTFRAKLITHIYGSSVRPHWRKEDECTDINILAKNRCLHFMYLYYTLCILLPSNSISFQTEMLVCIQMIVAQLDERWWGSWGLQLIIHGKIISDATILVSSGKTWGWRFISFSVPLRDSGRVVLPVIVNEEKTLKVPSALWHICRHWFEKIRHSLRSYHNMFPEVLAKFWRLVGCFKSR